MTFDENVELLKKTYIYLFTNTALAGITKLIPFIGASSFLTRLITKLLEKLFTWMANQKEMLIFFKNTDFRVSRQGKDFIRDAQANFEAQQNGTEEEKRNAEEQLKKSFKAFASLRN